MLFFLYFEEHFQRHFKLIDKVLGLEFGFCPDTPPQPKSGGEGMQPVYPPFQKPPENTTACPAVFF